MKRNILIIVAITIILLLVSPALIGSRIEQGIIKDLIAYVPEESGIVLNETNYEGGWFSSSAELEVDYPALSELIETSIKLKLNLELKHGPLIFTDGGPSFGMVYASIVPEIEGIDLQEIIGDVPFESPEFVFSLLAKFNQSLQISMEMGEIDIEEGGNTFYFQGLSASVELDPQQGSRTELEAGSLNLANSRDNFQLSISGLSASSSTENIEARISPTVASMLIPQIKSTSPYAFEINNVGMDYEVEPAADEENKFNIHQSMEIKEAFMDFPLKSAKVVMEINKLSAELITLYEDFIASMQGQISLSNQADLDQRIAQLSEDFSLLLLHESLEYKMLLAANVYGGEHNLELDVRWLGLPDARTFSDIDMKEALQALEVKLTLESDEAALMASPLGPDLDNFQNQNYVVSQNGKLVVEAELIDSKLTVNGDVLPIDEMLPQ